MLYQPHTCVRLLVLSEERRIRRLEMKIEMAWQ